MVWVGRGGAQIGQCSLELETDGISTGHICPGVWPLHGGRGWSGSGKANQGVAWALPWGPGALEELRQLEATLPDATASWGQPGSSADAL